MWITYANTSTKQNVSYACSECGFKFPKKDELKNHILSHKDEKLVIFGCGECKENFNSNKELVLHMNMYADKQKV